MRRALDDMRGYYLLGYYSTNAKADGTFRSIKVTVKRPGVNVRARRGYLAAVENEMKDSGRGGAGVAAPPRDGIVVDTGLPGDRRAVRAVENPPGIGRAGAGRIHLARRCGRHAAGVSVGGGGVRRGVGGSGRSVGHRGRRLCRGDRARRRRHRRRQADADARIAELRGQAAGGRHGRPRHVRRPADLQGRRCLAGHQGDAAGRRAGGGVPAARRRSASPRCFVAGRSRVRTGCRSPTSASAGRSA